MPAIQFLLPVFLLPEPIVCESVQVKFIWYSNDFLPFAVLANNEPCLCSFTPACFIQVVILPLTVSLNLKATVFWLFRI
jgi:hypothetical protein